MEFMVSGRDTLCPVRSTSFSLDTIYEQASTIGGRPLLLLPPIPLSNRVFSNKSTLRTQRLVWAAKQALGNAALGALCARQRALLAGGFGSLHTPGP